MSSPSLALLNDTIQNRRNNFAAGITINEIEITDQFAHLNLVRSTTKGKVKGVYNSNTNTIRFIHIPYAKPPVGDLRFRPPQDADAWTDVLYNTAPTLDKASVQPAFLAYGVPSYGTEDCLYLDVFTRPEFRNRPVMVFIHGGGNELSHGVTPIFTERPFCNDEDIVQVNLNYRLGALGFYSDTALQLEDNGSLTGTTGNYGMLDIIKALEWVRDNIANFGGNPHNVTILGNSSGGGNVAYLLGSPLTRDGPESPILFDKAIAQSGSYQRWPVVTGDPYYPDIQDGVEPTSNINIQRNERLFAQNPDLLSIETYTSDDDRIAALRAAPAANLQTTWYTQRFAQGGAGSTPGPAIDGIVFEHTITDLLNNHANTFPDRQLIIGSCSDEFGAFPYDIGEWITDNVKPSFGLTDASTDAVKSLYSSNATPNGTYEPNDSSLIDDFGIIAQFELARLAASGIRTTKPVIFNLAQETEHPYASNLSRGSHGVELPYVFNGDYASTWVRHPTINAFDPIPELPSYNDRLASSRIRRMWAEFMTNGNPVVGGKPWPDAPDVLDANSDILLIEEGKMNPIKFSEINGGRTAALYDILKDYIPSN